MYIVLLDVLESIGDFSSPHFGVGGEISLVGCNLIPQKDWLSLSSSTWSMVLQLAVLKKPLLMIYSPRDIFIYTDR